MTPPDPNRPNAEKTVGELVFEVTERTSALIREEIELAKAEVSEKVTTLARGGAVGIAAGIFAFLALILLMFAFALGLNSLFFEGEPWAGFLIEAIILSIIGGLIGLVLVFFTVQGLSAAIDFKLTLDLKNIIWGISTSAIIGFIAGIIPAIVAARMRPVDAIRFK